MIHNISDYLGLIFGITIITFLIFSIIIFVNIVLLLFKTDE